MAIRKFISIISLVALLILMTALVGCGGAGSSTSATVQGTIKLIDKPSGQWDGISVTLTGPDNFAAVLTAMDGSFTIPNVTKSGTYTLQATKTGYFCSAIDPIVVSGIKVYDVKDYLTEVASGNVLLKESVPTPPAELLL